MARINYPEDFLNQTELFKKVKAKHDADGGSSPLTPFLTEHSIDLGTDDTNTETAKQKDLQAGQKSRVAEDDTQDRDNLFNPVFDNMRKGLQFLKKFYVGNTKELGNWGAEVNGDAIVYPPEFLKRVELFKAYKAKHDSLGAGSPLTPFLNQNNIDLGDDDSDTDDAKDKHDSAKQNAKDAEDLNEERDNLFDPVMGHVRQIGQYLKGLYVDHPKHLGNWGYEVDDSPPTPRRNKREIPPGGKKTVTDVDTSKELWNIGVTQLTVFAGSLAQGEGTEVPVDGKLPLSEEFEILTVRNDSEDEQGEFSVVY